MVVSAEICPRTPPTGLGGWDGRTGFKLSDKSPSRSVAVLVVVGMALGRGFVIVLASMACCRLILPGLPPNGVDMGN